MSEIRKHKGIVVVLFVLVVLVFVKHTITYVDFSSTGIKKENSLKQSAKGIIKDIVIANVPKPESCITFIKKVFFQKSAVHLTNQNSKLISSHFLYCGLNFSLPASILKFKCVLRI